MQNYFLPLKKQPPKISKSIRFALLFLFFLSCFVISLPLLAGAVIGEEALKEKIIAKLEEVSGEKAEIKGRAYLTIWPWMGVRCEELSLGQDLDLSAEPFVLAKKMTISLEKIPLLLGRIILDGIILNEPEIRFVRLADGRRSGEKFASTPKGESAAGEIALPEKLEISGATIFCSDELYFPGRLVQLENLDLFVTNKDNHFNFRFSTRAKSLPIEAKIFVDGKFVFGGSAQPKWALADTRLAVELFALEGDTIFGKIPLGGGGGTLDVYLAKLDAEGAIDLKDFRLQGFGSSFSIKASGEKCWDNPKVKGKIQSWTHLGSPLFKVLGFHFPLAPDAPRQDSVSILLPKKRHVNNTPLAAAHVMSSSAGESADEAEDQPEVSEKTEEEEPWVLYGEAGFAIDEGSVSSDNLSLAIGSGKLFGRIKFDFGDRSEVFFDLHTEEVGLERLWPSFSASGLFIPVNLLEQVRFDGRLDFKNIDFFGVSLTRGSSRVLSEAGKMRIYPVWAQTPRGFLSLDSRLHAEDGSLKVDTEIEFTVFSDLPGEEVPQKMGAYFSGTVKNEQIQGKTSFFGVHPGQIGNAVIKDGLSSSDLDILGALSGSADFSMPLNPAEKTLFDVNFKNINCRILDVKVTGNAELALANPPRLTLGLNLDHLDIHKLEAFFAEDSLSLVSSGNADAKSKSLDEIVRVNGSITVDRLLAFDLQLEKFSFLTDLKGKHLNIGFSSPVFFGGQLEGTLEGDLKDKSQFVFAAKVSGASANTLMKQILSGSSSSLYGKTDLQINGNFSGENFGEILDSFRVTANLAMPSGGEVRGDGKGGDRREKKPASYPFMFSGLTASLALNAQKGAPEDLRKLVAAEINLKAQIGGSIKDLELSFKGPLQISEAGKLSALKGASLQLKTNLLAPLGNAKKMISSVWQGTLNANLEAGTADLNNIKGEWAGVKARGKASLAPSGIWHANINVPEFAPRPVFALLGWESLKKAPATSLKKCSLDLDLSFGSGSLKVTKGVLNLDDSMAQFTANMLDAFEPIEIKARIDRFVWENIFGPAEEQDKQKLKLEDKKPFDLDFLRRLGFSLDLYVEDLQKEKTLHLKKVHSVFKARSGNIQGVFNCADYFGGSLSANFWLDARGKDLKSSLKLNINGTELGPMFKSLTESEIITAGKGSFRLDLHSKGINKEGFKHNLSGIINIDMKKGAFLLNLDSSSNNKKDDQETTKAPQKTPAKKAEATHFNSMATLIKINRGHCLTNDFNMAGTEFSVKGKGSYNLVNDALDVELIAENDGYTIPITVKGTLEDPIFKVDRSSVLGQSIFRLFKNIFTAPLFLFNKLSGQ